jgi:hypothetical protein
VPSAVRAAISKEVTARMSAASVTAARSVAGPVTRTVEPRALMSAPNAASAAMWVSRRELKDIQLPDSMKRAMARQAEAEREKRAKIINAEGESLAAAALGEASDIMMAHPLALQLRNLQSLVEIGVDKNTTVVFPAPLMTTIAELGSFLAGEKAAAGLPAAAPAALVPAADAIPVNGSAASGPPVTGAPTPG